MLLLWQAAKPSPDPAPSPAPKGVGREWKSAPPPAPPLTKGWGGVEVDPAPSPTPKGVGSISFFCDLTFPCGPSSYARPLDACYRRDARTFCAFRVEKEKKVCPRAPF